MWSVVKSNVVVSQYKPDTTMVVELSKEEVFAKIESAKMLDDHKNAIETFLLSYVPLINNSEQDLINRVVKLLELYEQSDESTKNQFMKTSSCKIQLLNQAMVAVWLLIEVVLIRCSLGLGRTAILMWQLGGRRLSLLFLISCLDIMT